MLCQFVVYVRLVLTTLILVACLIGDNFVETTRHPLLKALCDNATHAVIGALTGMSFVVHFYDRISHVVGWLMIFGCFTASSFIDLDHFLEARSLSLHAATSITYRPFLHCSTIPLILLCTFCIISCLNYFKTSLALGILCCAFITHHTRDAIRRGYWFCPFGHTPKLPYALYIFLTMITPYVMFYLYTISRSNFVQNNFVGNNKYNEGSIRSNTKYSIV